MSIDTKRGRVVTYRDRLPALKPHFDHVTNVRLKIWKINVQLSQYLRLLKLAGYWLRGGVVTNFLFNLLSTISIFYQ